jgi:hypothetical protein
VLLLVDPNVVEPLPVENDPNRESSFGGVQ